MILPRQDMRHLPNYICPGSFSVIPLLLSIEYFSRLRFYFVKLSIVST